MKQKRCAGCGELFSVLPHVPGQTYCSAPTCQRARKRLWQKAKLQTDPDYRENQRAAQEAWVRRNPDYWKRYRSGGQSQAQRPKHRSLPPEKHRGRHIKMDVCHLPAGLYRITRHREVHQRIPRGSLLVQLTPIRIRSAHKMDSSREDMIDIRGSHS